MITSLEFDNAVKLISAYKLQLENEIIESGIVRKRLIDIKENITNVTFSALKKYYLVEYNIKLDWDDLKDMDVNLLAAIDFNKLSNASGFGLLSLFNFKKLLVIHSVLKKEELDFSLKQLYKLS